MPSRGEPNNSGDNSPEEREPETIHQLAEALHDFYGFDVAQYIHSHGTIGDPDRRDLQQAAQASDSNFEVA